MFHVPNDARVKSGPYGSHDTAGNNGQFVIDKLLVVASDGEGWEHVSVSMKKKTPTWKQMCRIKDIFWDEDDVVIQYHPAKKDYVNYHPYCLHLWRPVGFEIPVPRPVMVGPPR